MPPRWPAKAYLVCGTPRTGSTLLCQLLASTGVAGKPESYFRQPDEPMWAQRWGLEPVGQSFDYQAYAEAAVAAGSTPNGVFGARVMWGTIERMTDCLRGERAGTPVEVLARQFGPLRFVHLFRLDVVSQAVSWYLAEQTGVWHQGDLGDEATGGSDPVYDFEAIRLLETTVREHNAAWEAWFEDSGVSPYRVSYEELVAQPAEVTHAILTFLDVGPLPTPPMALETRPSGRLKEDWVSRYRADLARATGGGGAPGK